MTNDRRPEIGIMQGRLLPPFEGRFQAFPAGLWEEEFTAAALAGLGCIEWIFEKPHEADNPLGSAEGIEAIRRASRRSGVAVRSVCADYYMQERLIDDAGRRVPAVEAHLAWLCGQAGQLDVTYMVLPFVDASSLRSEAARAAAVALLQDMAPVAGAQGLELHVECDLPPDVFRGLLDAVARTNIKANFDIGNSASLGYDPADEVPMLAPYLGSVHVKDRLRGGGTQPLGTGDARLGEAFRQLRGAGFQRWFILQAARGEDGGERDLAARNRDTVEALWRQAG